MKTQTLVSVALQIAAWIINIALAVMAWIAMIKVFGWLLSVGLWIASLALAIAAAWLLFDEQAGERIHTRLANSYTTFKSTLKATFKREPKTIAVMKDGTAVREGDFVPQV